MQTPPMVAPDTRKKRKKPQQQAKAVQPPPDMPAGVPRPGTDEAQAYILKEKAKRKVAAGDARRRAEADRINAATEQRLQAQAANDPRVAGKQADAAGMIDRTAKVRQSQAARRGVAPPPVFDSDTDARTVKAFGGRYKSVGQRQASARDQAPSLARRENDQQRRRGRNLTMGHDLGIRDKLEAIYARARQRPEKGKRINPDALHAEAEQLIAQAQAARPQQAAPQAPAAPSPGTASKPKTQDAAQAADTDRDGRLSQREQVALETYTKILTETRLGALENSNARQTIEQQALRAAQQIDPNFGKSDTDRAPATSSPNGNSTAQGPDLATNAGTIGYKTPGSGPPGLSPAPAAAQTGAPAIPQFLPQAQYTGNQTQAQETAGLIASGQQAQQQLNVPPVSRQVPQPAPPAVASSQVRPGVGLRDVAPPFPAAPNASNQVQLPAPPTAPPTQSMLATQGLAPVARLHDNAVAAAQLSEPALPSRVPPNAQRTDSDATRGATRPARRRPSVLTSGAATRAFEQATQPGTSFRTITLTGTPEIDNALVQSAASGSIIIAPDGRKMRKR